MMANELKGQCGFIGVGQCGSNIAYEFEQMGYKTLIVNTSTEDLASINCPNKYHIKKGEGAAKDRRVAKLTVREDLDSLKSVIRELFADKEVIFVSFSMGGGTGSGISPALCGIIADELGKIVVPIAVAPNQEVESLSACHNAASCVTELFDITELGCTFILDNATNENKFHINKEFAKNLDRFINVKNGDIRGSLDVREKKKLFKVNGYAILSTSPRDKSSWEDICESFNRNFCVPMEADRIISGFGFSTTRMLNPADVKRTFGRVVLDFYGVGDERNVALLVGLSAPVTRFNEIIKEVKNGAEEMKKVSEKRNSFSFGTVDSIDGILSAGIKKEESKGSSARNFLDVPEIKSSRNLLFDV